MLTYAQILTRTLQFLQNTGATVYDATEAGYAIENEIKRLSSYSPVLVDAVYQIESRSGTDVTGTASSLTDAVKAQFVTADGTNEKVVHNTTDDTWAVIMAQTSASVVTLSADIMDANENYEIYNKRCRNKKQVYLGDNPPYIRIASVEYPIGVERNFTIVSRDVIELVVDDGTILDSDSSLSVLNSVDVLVKFEVPQVLCQLTDLAGAVHTTAAAGALTMQVKSFTDAQIIEIGDQFTIKGSSTTIGDHKTTYIITAITTLANQATTGSAIYFIPGLEAVATADAVVTFVTSTLQPIHEEILEQLVAAYLKISDAETLRTQAIADLTTGRALITTINAAGQQVAPQYASYASAGLAVARELIASARQEQSIVFQRLESLARARKSKILPRGLVSV